MSTVVYISTPHHQIHTLVINLSPLHSYKKLIFAPPPTPQICRSICKLLCN